MAIPRIVCTSAEPQAAAVLRAVVADLVPDAIVEASDTETVRNVPDADCVVLSVGTLYDAGLTVARDLRLRGFRGGILIVATGPQVGAPGEAEAMGVGAVVDVGRLAEDLPSTLVELLFLEAKADQSAEARACLDSLRRLQSLVAAGLMARGLQHRLNNPLAALLAEAQLLSLEPMAAEHRSALERIVELCRRLVEVTRTIPVFETRQQD
ncbi:MAG: histidine kinase dimerization/phospho-acceptor domain-containing protein [Gemmatimonadota bacterium]